MTEYNVILEKIFNLQIENIKKDILKYNPNVTDFIVYSEKTANYNIFLVYGTGHKSVLTHIYRMVIIENEFENGTVIFENGNVICDESYNLETVKKMAKIRLQNAINQL